MYGQIATVAFVGIEARPIEVQVRISGGGHVFAIVGLPDKAVAESRERVRNALHAVGLGLPFKHITVNLAPADLPRRAAPYRLRARITKGFSESRGDDVSSLQAAGRVSGWIVCAWFTPDYAHWADKPVASLDVHSIPHDIVQVPKLDGGWERNTMAKAGHVLAAMDRHPDKVIVFLDVDCIVRGDLGTLAGLRGDVAFLLPVKRKASGVRLKPLSGTMVIRPTPQARRFIEGWAAAGRDAAWGAIDQHTLAVAMSTCPGVTIEVLEGKWCGLPERPGDEDALIVHDNASRDLPKLSTTRRRVWALWRGVSGSR